jgi:hypothetical protein
VHHEAFNNSKYCICPGGPELDRTIALAIHYGCVPGDKTVLLSYLLLTKFSSVVSLSFLLPVVF